MSDERADASPEAAVEVAARAIYRRFGADHSFPTCWAVAEAALAAAAPHMAGSGEAEQTRCSGCTERVQNEQPLRYRSGVLWHESCLRAAQPDAERATEGP